MGSMKIHSDVGFERVGDWSLDVMGADTSVLLVVVYWGGDPWIIASSASLAFHVLLKMSEFWLVSVQTSSGPVDL